MREALEDALPIVIHGIEAMGLTPILIIGLCAHYRQLGPLASAPFRWEL